MGFFGKGNQAVAYENGDKAIDCAAQNISKKIR